MLLPVARPADQGEPAGVRKAQWCRPAATSPWRWAGEHGRGGPTVTITGSGELSSLRMLCHDLIEPAATIRLLARAASTDLASEPATQDRLRLIADEAAQIALICEP